MAKCRIRWFVYAGGGQSGQPLEKIPHTASMRGHWPGWDAECTTHGYQTRTGGAIKASVQRDVEFHKWEAEHGYLAEERSR